MSKSNGEKQTNFNAIGLGNLRGRGMEVKLKIIKFEQYLPRKDLVHTNWIRFEVDTLNHPDFFRLTGNELKAFFHFIFIAGKMKSDEIRMDVEHVAHCLKIEHAEVLSAIEKLSDKRWEIQQSTCNSDLDKSNIGLPVQVEKNRIEEKREEQNRKEEKRGRKKVTRTASPSAPIEGVNEVIKLYCDTWKLRYKSDRSPDIRGKDVGLVKGLVKDLGRSRVELLVQAYLSMPDGWFVTKKHDITTLIANMNSVSLFADSGRLITKSEINQLDKQVTNQNTLEALKKGAV